jgi:hypothetical protein
MKLKCASTASTVQSHGIVLRRLTEVGSAMKMKSATVLSGFLAGVLAISPMAGTIVQAQEKAKENAERGKASLSVPISGTARLDANPAVSSALTGTFTIQKFVKNGNNGVDAVGTLSASFTDPVTNAARTIVTQASIPVDRAASGGAASAAEADTEEMPTSGPAVAVQPACDVLNLVLGPLDLNLLGLRIQLNQVVLDITAVPGAGNLLGNLLCTIVGILDAGGPLAQVVALLNGLLALLG